MSAVVDAGSRGRHRVVPHANQVSAVRGLGKDARLGTFRLSRPEVHSLAPRGQVRLDDVAQSPVQLSRHPRLRTGAVMQMRTWVIGQGSGTRAQAAQHRGMTGDGHPTQSEDAVGEPFPLTLRETPTRVDGQLANPRRRHPGLDDGNPVVADEGQLGGVRGLQHGLVALPGQGRHRTQGRPTQERTSQAGEVPGQLTGRVEGHRPSNRKP